MLISDSIQTAHAQNLPNHLNIELKRFICLKVPCCLN